VPKVDNNEKNNTDRTLSIPGTLGTLDTLDTLGTLGTYKVKV